MSWFSPRALPFLTQNMRQTTRAQVITEAHRVVGEGRTSLPFDIDGLDPIYAIGTGAPEPRGLSMGDAQVMLRGPSGQLVWRRDLCDAAPDVLHLVGVGVLMYAHRALCPLLVSLCLLLWGCAAPSTLMVNDEGRVYRCASVGWGIIGIAMDTDMHTGCVADMQRLGYVPMGDAWLGMHTKHGTAEIVRFSPKSHAPDAGIRVGDVVLKVDDRPALPWPERMRTLEGKKAGERVDVTILRDGQAMTVPVRLQARGD
jgi:hypothetical protein